MHLPLLNFNIIDYLKLPVCVEMALLSVGGSWLFFFEKVFQLQPFPAASERAIKRKSGTTRGACLPDVVYCSLCKIWGKDQAAFLI
jgi:hypothetical protein